MRLYITDSLYVQYAYGESRYVGIEMRTRMHGRHMKRECKRGESSVTTYLSSNRRKPRPQSTTLCSGSGLRE